MFLCCLFAPLAFFMNQRGYRSLRVVHVRLVESGNFITISTLLRGCFTFHFCSPTMRHFQKYLHTSVAYFLSCAGIIAVVLKHPVLV